MQLRARLAQSEYRNWVEVGQALLILSEPVQVHTSVVFKAFYDVLTVKVGPKTKCHCTHAPEMHHTPSCRWAQAIISYHREPSKIKWLVSNSSKWHDPVSGPSEIASVFAGGQLVDGLRNLRALRFCSYFSISEKTLGDVIDVWRKLWANAQNQKIIHQDKRRAFDAVTKLLLEFPFKTDADSERTLKEIESIEYWDLPVLQTAEMKVARNYRKMLEVKRRKKAKDIMDLDARLDNVESFLFTMKDDHQKHTSVPLHDSLLWFINLFAFNVKTQRLLLPLCLFLSLCFRQILRVIVIVVLMVLVGSVTMLLSMATSGFAVRCTEPSCP